MSCGASSRHTLHFHIVIILLTASISVLSLACTNPQEERAVSPPSLAEALEYVDIRLLVPIEDYEAVWPIAAAYYKVAEDDIFALRNRDLRTILVGLAFIRSSHSTETRKPYEQKIIDITAEEMPQYTATGSFDGINFYDMADAIGRMADNEDSLPVGAEIDWVELAILEELARRELPPPPRLSPNVDHSSSS